MVGVRDLGSGRSGVMSWEQLRAYGIEWHRRRGADFSGASARLLKKGEAG
jgi:hypothetical protein